MVIEFFVVALVDDDAVVVGFVVVVAVFCFLASAFTNMAWRCFRSLFWGIQLGLP